MDKRVFWMLALLSGVVHAGDWTSGVRLGYGQIDASCSVGCEDQSFSAGGWLGYEFNDAFSVEYSVDKLGEYQGRWKDDGLRWDASLWGLSLTPKLTYPLGARFDVFVNAGVAYYLAGNDGDLAPTYGVGVSYALTDRWDVRAQYQRIQSRSSDFFDGLDMNLVTVGASYRWGTEAALPLVAESIAEVDVVTEVVEHDGVVMVVPFTLDSAALSARTEMALDELVDFMLFYPQSIAVIKGYTDISGPVEYNDVLSLTRAQTVRDFLVSNGVNDERLNVEAEGSQDPVASNSTRQGREANRRVEIVIAPFEYLP